MRATGLHRQANKVREREREKAAGRKNKKERAKLNFFDLFPKEEFE